eukprot:gene11620-21861_t
MGDIDVEFIPDTQSEDYEEPAFSFQAIKSATGKSYQSKEKIKKFEWKDEIVELSDDEGGKFAYSIGAKPSAKTAKQADSQVNQLIERAINILDRPKETPKQQEAAKSADRVFAEMLGGMLETIQDGQAKDSLKMELQRLIYETKYMSQNRGMQPSYYRNSGVQPGSAFHGMLGQEPNQPTFHCPSPLISTGSYNSSSRSGAEDERFKEL